MASYRGKVEGVITVKVTEALFIDKTTGDFYFIQFDSTDV